MRSLILSLLAYLFLAGSLTAFEPTEDGLYAVFDTSMGEFTAELFFEDTPQTVANIVGLAEGSQSWTNLETGKIQHNDPFYDGIIFHRVIADFIIQTGSPNQQGTDGPGYDFFDEIIPNNPIFSHDRAGVLSMANNGQGNTNGSQFFVTLDPTPHLDGKHTVFGQVIDGMDVVEAIGNVPTDGNDRPLEDVVINSLTIVREGAAAIAFNANDHGLPTLATPNPPLEITNDAGEINLVADLNRDTYYSFFVSDELESWIYIGPITRQATDFGPSPLFNPPVSNLDPTGQRFWQGVQASYPSLPDMTGYSIDVTPTEPNTASFDILLTANYSGTIDIDDSGSPNTILNYQWYQYGDYINLTIFAQGLVKLQFYFPVDGGEGLLWIGPSQTSSSRIQTGLQFTITPPAP
ncbi:MAG: peptidylprolyl isomerase [Puniceicoccales bacterium]